MQSERNQSHTRYAWSSLNRIQKGTYGEYFAKMEFTMYGFEVYTSEVDDRGVDFVVRRPPGGFFDIQVKTITDMNLAYVNKNKFKQIDSYLVLLVRLHEGEPPQLFVFRGIDWDNSNKLLVYNPYDGKKSAPAYEVHLTKDREEMLSKYSFDRVVPGLVATQ